MPQGYVVQNYLFLLQIGKYDRQFWEQSVEQEVLKVLLLINFYVTIVVSALMLLLRCRI